VKGYQAPNDTLERHLNPDLRIRRSLHQVEMRSIEAIIREGVCGGIRMEKVYVYAHVWATSGRDPPRKRIGSDGIGLINAARTPRRTDGRGDQDRRQWLTVKWEAGSNSS